MTALFLYWHTLNWLLSLTLISGPSSIKKESYTEKRMVYEHSFQYIYINLSTKKIYFDLQKEKNKGN